MIQLDNRAIRKRMIAKRKALSEVEVKRKSEQICERCLPYVHQAKSVGIYSPINNEVDVTSLLTLAQHNRIFALPRVISKTEMEMVSWHNNILMSCSSFGIQEPQEGEILTPTDLDVILIPLVAFRHDGVRLGYGAGYYDRYLQHCTALKIGIAYAFQCCDECEERPHDQLMDVVITETQCIISKYYR